IGCGTARNLRKLAYYYPNNQFYGVDASALMLESARKQLAGSLYESQIHLQQGLAEQLSLNHAPNAQGFDHILLSYVLSMLPQAAPTLQHIIGLVKPGGYLHIVDFADQADLPNWFQGLLKQWLTWFNVHPQLSIMQPLEQSALQQTGVLQKRYIAGRYAVLIHYQKL
ncbi:MAG: class I SAM-dependent methyltransferase, partial [Thiotrichaceae bacterium]